MHKGILSNRYCEILKAEGKIAQLIKRMISNESLGVNDRLALARSESFDAQAYQSAAYAQWCDID